jgi:linoleoyl-CoA desaturase
MLRDEWPDRDPYLALLKQRIEGYFERAGVSPYADARFWSKAALLFAGFAGLYVVLLAGELGPAAFVATMIGWGLVSALLAFNVPHDALHDAVSPHRWVNRALGYTFNLVGMNAYTWRLKHNVAHHSFTNIPGFDPDIEAAPIFHLSPAERRRPIHRWQHLYAPFAYMLLGLFFVAFIDFRLMFSRAFAARYGVTHPPREYAILFASKAAYFGYALVVPILVVPLPASTVVLGFVAMHAVVGVVSALVLLPSHCMEWAVFPTRDEHKGRGDAWIARQSEITLDFARESAAANWFLGGFNTNAFHHLFPKICHVHLRELTAIFATAASEHGKPYHQLSFAAALRSHFRFLRAMGRGELEGAA